MRFSLLPEAGARAAVGESELPSSRLAVSGITQQAGREVEVRRPCFRRSRLPRRI
jgi:hypothetical protein